MAVIIVNTKHKPTRYGKPLEWALYWGECTID